MFPSNLRCTSQLINENITNWLVGLINGNITNWLVGGRYTQEMAEHALEYSNQFQDRQIENGHRVFLYYFSSIHSSSLPPLQKGKKLRQGQGFVVICGGLGFVNCQFKCAHSSGDIEGVICVLGKWCKGVQQCSINVCIQCNVLNPKTHSKSHLPPPQATTTSSSSSPSPLKL